MKDAGRARRVVRWIAWVVAAIVGAGCYGLGVMAGGLWFGCVRDAWSGVQLANGGLALPGAIVGGVLLQVGVLGSLMAWVLWTAARRRATWLRRLAAANLLLNLLAVVSFPLGLALGRLGNRVSIRRFDDRADQLIGAICRYETDHGHPPTRLASLVPGYLDAVPGTGMADRPDFGYRPSPLYQRWYLPAAPKQPGFALVVYYAPWAGAVDVVLAKPPGEDRVPSARAFDAAIWRREPAARPAMAAGLASGSRLLGRSRAEVAALLGPPDDEGRLFPGRWRLTCAMVTGLDLSGFSYQPDSAPLEPWFARWDRLPMMEYEPPEDMAEE